jgi:hypothetical protein
MEVEVVDSHRAVFIVGALILPSDPWHQLKGSDRLLPQPRRTNKAIQYRHYRGTYGLSSL